MYCVCFFLVSLFCRATDHTCIMKLLISKLIVLVLSYLIKFVILLFVELFCASIVTSLLSVFCVRPGSEGGEGVSSSRGGFIVTLYPNR